MDYVHMRQPGDAVCHEPDGEKQGKNPLPRAGIEQEHTAAHHAENTGNQRHKGRKAGIFLQPDITQNIVYARNHRNQAVNRQDIRLDAFRETQVIPDDVFNVMKAAVVVVVPVMVFVIVAGMVMVMSVTMFMAMRMAVRMVVGMVVALLLHAVHFYGKMGPGNAALHRRFPRNGNAGKV